MDSFANRLADALAVRRIKQSKLAAQIGIGDAAISNYLKGRYEPQDDRLQLMAEALDVNPDWLRGYDVPMSENETGIFTQLTFDNTDNTNDAEKLLLAGYRRCNERDKAIIDLIISSYILK